MGSPQRHIIGKGETLLDVARDHGLGYQELAASYRHWDPFIPPTGAEIVIPTRWIVPENHKRNQIIVNTGDMRLYYYTNNATQVYTFPIGMGVLDSETPAGYSRWWINGFTQPGISPNLFRKNMAWRSWLRARITPWEITS